MTTWHDDEPLDEALDFFVNLTRPTMGLEANSNFWVAVSLADAGWTHEIQERLEQANLPIGDWPPHVR